MRYSLALFAAAATAVSAQSACDQIYNQCFGSGTPEEICRCDLQACLGQDNARGREYCASVTATLTRAAGNPNPSAPIAGTIVQPSGAPQITAGAGTIPLGGACGADEQCASGAQCFGSTAGTIRACGNFNAECTDDSQCAFNRCNIIPGAESGLCNGINPSGSFPPFSSTAPTYPPGVPVTYPAGSPSSAPYACNPAHSYPNGASCVSTSGTLALVTPSASVPAGDAPRQTYACNPAHSYPNGASCVSLALVTPQASAPAGTRTTTAATYASGNGTASRPTSSVVPYAGGANVVGALSGFAAMVAGAAAWVL